jgi:HK97 family phage major capsid protein
VALAAGRRDLTATGGSNGDQGGVTVPTSVGPLIDLLYAKMVLRSLGAQFLTGLAGNVVLPKLTAGSAGGHKAENAAADESSPTFGSVSLNPNRFSTFVEISKQLILQSNESVEGIVRNDLATALALGMESGALVGTGANNQPTGLLHFSGGVFASGITEVVGDTDGAAPSWANIVALETAVATLNADIGSLSYLTNPKVRGKMKATPKVASTDSIMLWENNSSPVNGYRAEVTTQVPSTLDKGSSTGVCSAMVFGNWSDLVVAMWGGLDIAVNPYSKDTEGLVRITAAAFYDTAVRRGSSFAALRDVLTA